MLLSQQVMAPRVKAWGDPTWRYDEEMSVKFDESRRKKPSDKVFRIMNRHAAAASHFEVPPALKALGLAQVAMQTRGRIGLVLGSNVRKLLHPIEGLPDLNDYGQNNRDGLQDVDVLVLETHDAINPAPHEWGIDWFVRPCLPNGHIAPTNRHVQTWFDISIPPGKATRIIEPYESQLAVNPRENTVSYSHSDEKGRKIKSLIERMRRSADEKYLDIPPGLYLPDSATIERILNHVRAKTQRAINLRDEIVGELMALEQLWQNKEPQFNLKYWSFLRKLPQQAREYYALRVGHNMKVDFPANFKMSDEYMFSPFFYRDMLLLENFPAVGRNFSYEGIEPYDPGRTVLPVLPDECVVFNPY